MRALDTLTSIFGRAPREGDIIPAESVDRYLKSLSADQFDKREDVEFFNHVRDAYRLAYPTTNYDISGRMSDSPPVAIPFKPWGEAKPRSPQHTGAGTGMPGILKASAPAEELQRFAQPGQQAQPEFVSENQRSFRSDSAPQSTPKPEETQIAQAPNAPQRPISPARPTPSTSSRPLPRLDDIDLAFIHEREDREVDMYVPKNSTTGKVDGNSGPSIGAGVDLGQRSTDDIDRLVTFGLSPALAQKLKPYVLMKGPNADAFVQNNPLTITNAEIDELSDAAYREIRGIVEEKFDNAMRAKGASVTFQKIDPAMRTVAMSVAVQFGGNIDKKAKRFWGYLINQDAQGMYDELRNFGPNHKPRREKEAEYLLKKWKGGLPIQP